MSADVSELQQALEQEREARLRAERERDALEQEHDEDQGVIRVWRGRCERAEQERDEARGDAEARKRVLAAERVGYQQVLDERDRAVADNAALLEAAMRLEPFLPRLDEGPSRFSEHARAAGGLRAIIEAEPHPGAALREYVRALEAVRKEVETWGHAEDCPAGYEEDGGACECAHGDMQALLAKADALKGKP